MKRLCFFAVCLLFVCGCARQETTKIQTGEQLPQNTTTIGDRYIIDKQADDENQDNDFQHAKHEVEYNHTSETLENSDTGLKCHIYGIGWNKAVTVLQNSKSERWIYYADFKTGKYEKSMISYPENSMVYSIAPDSEGNLYLLTVSAKVTKESDGSLTYEPDAEHSQIVKYSSRGEILESIDVTELVKNIALSGVYMYVNDYGIYLWAKNDGVFRISDNGEVLAYGMPEDLKRINFVTVNEQDVYCIYNTYSHMPRMLGKVTPNGIEQVDYEVREDEAVLGIYMSDDKDMYIYSMTGGVTRLNLQTGEEIQTAPASDFNMYKVEDTYVGWLSDGRVCLVDHEGTKAYAVPFMLYGD